MIFSSPNGEGVSTFPVQEQKKLETYNGNDLQVFWVQF